MKKTILAAAALAFLPTTADAAVAFLLDKTTFDADTSGITFTGIDFDSIAAGTDIAESTINGVTFQSPNGNTLDVVAADDTFTPTTGFTNAPNPSLNVLPATSGANILSPGGVELVPGPDIRQRDTMELVFDVAVSAVSFDILFQSLDRLPFTRVSVFDENDDVIDFFDVPAPPSNERGPGIPLFVGLVSDDPLTNIARLVISDFDGNADNPDSNIGLDSLRFEGSDMDPGDPVPVPGALPLFATAAFFGRRMLRKR